MAQWQGAPPRARTRARTRAREVAMPMTSTSRVHEHRRRKRLRRNGGAIVEITLENVGLTADWLVDLGFLNEWDTENIEKVQQALQKLANIAPIYKG